MSAVLCESGFSGSMSELPSSSAIIRTFLLNSSSLVKERLVKERRMVAGSDGKIKGRSDGGGRKQGRHSCELMRQVKWRERKDSRDIMLRCAI